MAEMLAKTDDSRLAAGLIRPAPATDKQVNSVRCQWQAPPLNLQGYPKD